MRTLTVTPVMFRSDAVYKSTTTMLPGYASDGIALTFALEAAIESTWS